MNSFLRKYGKVTNTNNENIKRFSFNGNEVTLERVGKKLVFKNRSTKGPGVIAIPVLAAKSAGFTKITYDPENNGHTLRYLGFIQANPYSPYTLNTKNINSARLEKITRGNLNNYKKYMNARPLSKLNLFNRGLEKLKNQVKVNRPRRNVRVLMTPNEKAKLRLTFKNDTVEYSLGETNANYRGRGYGTLLRSIPIQLAREAGFKRITHRAVFMDPNQERAYKSKGRNVPPSRHIVQKLGFVPINNRNSILIL